MDDARISELEQKVTELTALVARLSAPAVTATAHGEPVEAPTSRRGILKVAGAAAAGAAAVAVAGRATPAAADDPNDLTLGSTKTTAGLTQGRLTTPTAGANAFVFQVGSSYPNTGTFFPAALGGWSGAATMQNGVYGYTEAANGAGVVGLGNVASSVGVRAKGQKAAVLLDPLGTSGPARSDAHSTGELIEDVGGNLWLCVADGTPGTWRKLAGPATAGAFHPVAPTRVYDSRQPTPAPGLLGPNSNRVVSVKDGRNAAGAVTAPDAVPAGATAIAYNLTVTGATGTNFLAVEPGDSTTFVASAINFYAGTDIANASVVKVDASRQIKVFGGDIGGSTHFIIDVVGYYL